MYKCWSSRNETKMLSIKNISLFGSKNKPKYNYQYNAWDKKISEEQMSKIIEIFTRISHFFPGKAYFLLASNLFIRKTGYILIGFDVIFLMLSSEFEKLLNFGSNRKKLQRNHNFLNFFQ